MMRAGAGRFHLEESVLPYRGRAEFRELAAPPGPITCALKRCFHRKTAGDGAR